MVDVKVNPKPQIKCMKSHRFGDILPGHLPLKLTSTFEPSQPEIRTFHKHPRIHVIMRI